MYRIHTLVDEKSGEVIDYQPELLWQVSEMHLARLMVLQWLSENLRRAIQEAGKPTAGRVGDALADDLFRPNDEA